MSRKIDMTDQSFDVLTVIGPGPVAAKTVWLCRCVCGTEKLVTTDTLTNGRTKRCICFSTSLKSKTRHGGCGTKEYTSWKEMKKRCYNPKSTEYFRYGAKGVTVCDRWRDSFPNFLEDMGPIPEGKRSIDRYPDSDGQYAPGNCRWADDSQQTKNRKCCRYLELRGERKIAKDWAEEMGIPYRCLISRLNRGWSVEQALTIPVDTVYGLNSTHQAVLPAINM